MNRRYIRVTHGLMFRYSAAVVAVGVAALLSQFALPMGKTESNMVFFLALLPVALYLGAGPYVLSLGIGTVVALSYDRMSVMELALFLIGSSIFGYFTSVLNKEKARLREQVAIGEMVRAELSQHKEHLEAIIKLRTIDLETANLQLKGEVALRTHVEKTLCESNERLRCIVDEMPAGVAISGAETVFRTVNSGLVELLGYSSKEELLKVPITSIYDNPNERQKILELLKKNRSTGWISVLFRRKDGSVLRGVMSLQVYKAKQGETEVIGLALREDEIMRIIKVADMGVSDGARI